MDFSIDDTTSPLRDPIRTFVDDVLIAFASKAETYDEHENVADGILENLRHQGRESGLWALRMPCERGGGGLSLAHIAVCYEEMNRSIFGQSCSTQQPPTMAI